MGWNNADLPTHQIYANIVILLMISIDFFGHQHDVVIYPARCSLEQSLCCGDVSFSHLLLPNCERLFYEINKVI